MKRNTTQRNTEERSTDKAKSKRSRVHTDKERERVGTQRRKMEQAVLTRGGGGKRKLTERSYQREAQRAATARVANRGKLSGVNTGRAMSQAYLLPRNMRQKRGKCRIQTSSKSR
jgi:hypothetical protein